MITYVWILFQYCELVRIDGFESVTDQRQALRALQSYVHRRRLEYQNEGRVLRRERSRRTGSTRQFEETQSPQKTGESIEITTLSLFCHVCWSV